MDATSQFEDINHSGKAQQLMRGFYIGDFVTDDDKAGKNKRRTENEG